MTRRAKWAIGFLCAVLGCAIFGGVWWLLVTFRTDHVTVEYAVHFCYMMGAGVFVIACVASYFLYEWLTKD